MTTLKTRLTTYGPRKVVSAGRKVPTIRAAAGGWDKRVLDALIAVVDPAAIAAAARDGKDPATAAAIGVAPPDPLVRVLVAMYQETYTAGAAAAKAKLKGKTDAAAREGVVVAALADLLTRARTVASGILDTLRDRLGNGIEAIADLESDALLDMLEGIATDPGRAGLIAVTESQRGTLAGAIDTWTAAGVTEFTWVRHSGSDIEDVCADNNGTTGAFSPDDIPAHPNCQCSLEPVT